MLTFLTRRIAAGIATLVVAIFLMYLLVDLAIDPLADLVDSTAPNKAELIQARINLLHLDQSVFVRFFTWAGHFITGDFGTAWKTGQEVGPLVGHAIGSTLQLVTAATVLSLVLGVAVGVVSALRQYSTFDYVIIFVSFLLYSLPSFWIAILLKQWGAIGFNDFLADPVIAWPTIALFAVVSGLVWMIAVGGSRTRRIQTFAIAAVATFSAVAFVQLTDWWSTPHFGPVLIGVTGLALAFAVSGLSAGFGNRKALYTAVTTVLVGLVLYYPMQALFDNVDESNLLIAGLAVVAIGIGYLLGYLFRGPDWRVSSRVGAIVAFLVASMIYIDQILQVWPAYFRALKGRPIPTFGDSTPNLGGNYWVQTLDSLTHLLLPTLTLILVAFAAYTRYSRSSMLEVMSQDYIRTARAKGLNERTVVMRHGFRNTLIPLATIVPIDIITLIGGAVITEAVFARPGMGALFVTSLQHAEIDPVMAYLVITAALAIIANIVADLVYAAVDPRIRLNP
ncbi:peptide/nickel transport system permease protein [Sanguibacter gelidistatuariae]|uniref:Peptide/nickel transport system permease protein n=1 Tax=Sanguibacter gelidistatuariae TaxID=1814289 RepID=A0A1G6MD99_9MICO|nr:ABC transporter permease [Sanguibacter gelidistatuariae]SDC53421.1 peptide/nickel transport system permease protein [Sanguibacter gelidistatuariae]